MAVSRSVIVLCSSLLLGACYQGAEEAGDIASTRDTNFNSVEFNGIKLQGIKLQGIKLQGIKLQGIKLQGIKLQGIKLQGIKLQGIKLQGTEFKAYSVVNGKTLPRGGTDFIGSEWELAIDSVDEQNKPVSETFVLRIDDMTPDPNYDDVYLYDVTYRSKLGGEWQPLCTDGLPSIPLNNYWNEETGDRIDDADVVTFACTDAVLAKCVEWGYRPWATADRCKLWWKDKKCGEISLRDYHQACTRMARADYCGDGTPWTVPGTAIDIYDHLSPQVESAETNWYVEAEWNPDGAYCLNDIRQQAWKAQGMYPKCEGKKNKHKAQQRWDCGSLNNHRAMLVSSFDKPKKKGDYAWNFNDFWKWK